jgi:hypothetical protein
MTVEKENALFCVDSSIFITLHRFYGLNFLKDVWIEFDELFENNKIISHILVYEELTTNAKNQDDLSKWIKSKKKYFKDYNANQAGYLSEIIPKFPGLIDYEREKNQADPWLIALAIEEDKQIKLFNPKQEVVVVSAESKTSSQKIPAVCRHFGIVHFDLFEFFEFHGWRLRLEKDDSH